jgi:hypothetical protein
MNSILKTFILMAGPDFSLLPANKSMQLWGLFVGHLPGPAHGKGHLVAEPVGEKVH